MESKKMWFSSLRAYDRFMRQVRRDAKAAGITIEEALQIVAREVS